MTQLDIKKLIYYVENDEIDTIHTDEPDLESIFMSLTGGELDR